MSKGKSTKLLKIVRLDKASWGKTEYHFEETMELFVSGTIDRKQATERISRLSVAYLQYKYKAFGDKSQPYKNQALMWLARKIYFTKEKIASKLDVFISSKRSQTDRKCLIEGRSSPDGSAVSHSEELENAINILIEERSNPDGSTVSHSDERGSIINNLNGERSTPDGSTVSHSDEPERNQSIEEKSSLGGSALSYSDEPQNKIIEYVLIIEDLTVNHSDKPQKGKKEPLEQSSSPDVSAGSDSNALIQLGSIRFDSQTLERLRKTRLEIERIDSFKGKTSLDGSAVSHLVMPESERNQSIEEKSSLGGSALSYSDEYSVSQLVDNNKDHPTAKQMKIMIVKPRRESLPQSIRQYAIFIASKREKEFISSNQILYSKEDIDQSFYITKLDLNRPLYIGVVDQTTNCSIKRTLTHLVAIIELCKLCVNNRYVYELSMALISKSTLLALDLRELLDADNIESNQAALLIYEYDVQRRGKTVLHIRFWMITRDVFSNAIRLTAIISELYYTGIYPTDCRMNLYLPSFMGGFIHEKDLLDDRIPGTTFEIDNQISDMTFIDTQNPNNDGPMLSDYINQQIQL